MTDENTGALRLTLAMDGAGVRLRSVRAVAMGVGPTDAVAGYEGEAGLWVELRDASERVVFRRVVADPRAPREAFGEGPTRTVFRAEEAPGEGLCVVVVPRDARARAAVVCEGASGLRVTARELARFALDAVR